MNSYYFHFIKQFQLITKNKINSISKKTRLTSILYNKLEIKINILICATEAKKLKGNVVHDIFWGSITYRHRRAEGLVHLMNNFLH